MATEVSICSNALRRLGEAPISSLTETGPNPSRCNDLWPTVRDAVLRAKLWNCCKKRVLLAPLTEAPAYDWTAQFLKPGDWLRTVQVGYDGEAWLFKDEGGKLLCNDTVLPLLYIFRNTNPQTYDSGLVEVMEAAMKAVLAYPVTKSTNVEAAAAKAFDMVLLRAGATSSQDDGPDDIGSYDLLAARFGFGGP